MLIWRRRRYIYNSLINRPKSIIRILLIFVQTMVHLMAHCLALHFVTMMGTNLTQMMVLQMVHLMAHC